MIFMLKPPTINILERVFFIRSKMCGTAFLVDYDAKQYMLSAAHVIGVGFPGHLDFMIDDAWSRIEAQLLSVDDAKDIAVLKLPVHIARHPAPLTTEGIMLGQHVFFLGYPFLDYSTASVFLGGRMPFPYCKWGSLAKMTYEDGGLVLSAMNNVGFSGGPIVFNDANGNQNICGMTIGMKEEMLPVVGIKEGDPTIGYAKQSTGLSFGCNAEAIAKQINKNPDGVPIP